VRAAPVAPPPAQVERPAASAVEEAVAPAPVAAPATVAASVPVSLPSQSASSQTAVNFCPQCGRRVTLDYRFCPGCGARLPVEEGAA